MGRRDIQAVYSLNNAQYEAFQMYFEGNSVSQIGSALNMTTSHAGKVLDEARANVWTGMTEKRVNRGEAALPNTSWQTSEANQHPSQLRQSAQSAASTGTPTETPQQRTTASGSSRRRSQKRSKGNR